MEEAALMEEERLVRAVQVVLVVVRLLALAQLRGRSIDLRDVGI